MSCRWRLVLAPILLVACGVPQKAPPEDAATPPRPAAESPPPPVTEAAEAMRPVPWDELPALLDDGGREDLLLALERNRSYLRRVPADRPLAFGRRQVPAGELRAAYDRLAGWLAAARPPADLAAQVAHSFDVYQSVGKGGGEMLVTGYFVPAIAASRRRGAEYQVPIYSPPGNLFRIDLGAFSDKYKGVRIAGILSGNRLLPHPDRREIREQGTLRGREIAWARDRVDVFFLEIQGSGVLLLGDGSEMRIGYAGSNGRAYRSIGRLLIEEGKIEREKVSMQSIRGYLAEHPEELEEILDYNQSMVFFRQLRGPALGSLGVPVTRERSIATDHRLFPKGALAFLQSEIPAMAEDGTTVAAGALSRFVFNQDTGGAIRGTDRVDFFWGRGQDAATRAGLMKQPGRLYFFVPKARGAAKG